jgi:hypothetical protein
MFGHKYLCLHLIMKSENKLTPLQKASRNYYYKHKEKVAAYKKAYNEANKESISKRQRKYREDNLEKCKQHEKEYVEKNKEVLRERYKEYRKRHNEKHKERISQQRKKQRAQKKEQIKEYNKKYNKKNKKTLAEKAKLYYLKNKEKLNQYNKKYNKENKEKVKQRRQEYRKNNKEKELLYSRAYREANREYISQYNAKYLKTYYKKRYNSDPLFKAKVILRSTVYAAFKRIGQNKPTNSLTLLGCSWEQAKAHIENLWTEGMCWETHGLGKGKWNIDHIRPVSSFKEDELDQMNLITNLQPLWHEDNQAKGDNYL